MAQVYDTGKIRDAARKINRVSARLDNEVADYMKRAAAETEELTGKTADSMEESIESLLREIRSISASMEDLSRKLKRYANNLDEADEKIASSL